MRWENEMEVASQVSEVEVVDRHSPNLLTMAMVETVMDAASRVRWSDASDREPRREVESSLLYLEFVRASADRTQSPAMVNAYEHVASDMVRRMSSTISKSVSEGSASYAGPVDGLVLTDPVRAQRNAGLQHAEKGAALAQPIFSTEFQRMADRELALITSRIVADLRDEGGREINEATTRLNFGVSQRALSPGADRPREERTGEEQRTLASYNAIATEGMMVASTKLLERSHLLEPHEADLLNSVAQAAGRRAEKAVDLDAGAPEHFEHRRTGARMAMAAAATAMDR